MLKHSILGNYGFCHQHRVRFLTVEDVSLLEGPPVWDPMADDLIDRRAARLGEIVVIQRGGVAIPGSAGLQWEWEGGYWLLPSLVE